MTPTVFTTLSSVEKEQLVDVALNTQFRILIGLQIKEKQQTQSSLSEKLSPGELHFKYFQLQREIRSLDDLLQFLTEIREEFIEEK